MNLLFVIINVISTLSAFMLGAFVHRQGMRLGFYKDKGYYPTPDKTPSPELEEDKDKGKKEKDWDGEI